MHGVFMGFVVPENLTFDIITMTGSYFAIARHLGERLGSVSVGETHSIKNADELKELKELECE